MMRLFICGPAIQIGLYIGANSPGPPPRVGIVPFSESTGDADNLLANGEIAVAIRRTTDGAHPQLRCVIGKDGMPLAYPQIRDSRNPETAIVEIVSASQYKAGLGSLNALWARSPSTL